MEKLVSVIIPCFNAKKWIRQAIDSCLNQTYPKIEVIVIDDGSTDSSLEIVKSYGDKVIWETGPNRGQAYARNRGFALSSGAYIQYLDADDYLLPEKIEKQVSFLQETGVDVVYSDFRYREHLPDGTSCLSDIKVCGPQEDVLSLLLSCKFFLQTSNPLFTRNVVANSEGWDKNCNTADDVDFFRLAAMNGMAFKYYPGCYMVHRKYKSNNRVTSNQAVCWNSRLLAAEKAEGKLVQLDKLSTRYRAALAHEYFQIAIFGCFYFDYSRYLEIFKKIIFLEPSFHPDTSILRTGGSSFNLLNNIFGFLIAGIIYKFLKDWRYASLMSR